MLRTPRVLRVPLSSNVPPCFRRSSQTLNFADLAEGLINREKATAALGLSNIKAPQLRFSLNGTKLSHDDSLKSLLKSGDIEDDDLVGADGKRQVVLDLIVKE